MTSTSSERDQRVVLRDLAEGTVASAHTAGELRRGKWTRLGVDTLLGDAVTESSLADVVERATAAGRAQGFAAGWADGIRASRQRAVDAHELELRALAVRERAALAAQESAAAAFDTVSARAEAAAATTLAGLADQAVELALAIAEAVLAREVQTPGAGAEALRRAVASTPLAAELVVRLHPEDAAHLDPTVLADRRATVVADESVALGDALVETETSVVEATVSAALDRVREVLAR